MKMVDNHPLYSSTPMKELMIIEHSFMIRVAGGDNWAK